MNEFTKEELFILLEETEGGIYNNLRKKLQSMIDNYEHKECSHENIDYTPMYQCEDCKKYVEMD